jgi:hypothetical protein
MKFKNNNMEQRAEEKMKLQQTLDGYVRDGLQADKANIKKDMCAQFADHRECAREYVVNASDAGATLCVVKGSKKDGIITLSFADDGKGMDKNGLIDFYTIYRSRKDHPNSKAVGRHGIGKLSVAAIPGQCGFEVFTSTGKETWYAKAGSLLENTPILISQLSTEVKSGTTFFIAFKSTLSLKKEMEAYRDILKKYVLFLPMLIQIWIPETDEDDSEQFPETINQEWPGNSLQYYKSYKSSIGNKVFFVVLGIGKTGSTIFQNGVMITGKYNLFSFGNHKEIEIPGLSILVDSPAFELPFGRHCLSNENVLKDLVYLIKNKLLPNFYTHLVHKYKTGESENYHFSRYSFELLTSALMIQDENTNAPWFHAPVFKCVNHKVISFNDIMDELSDGSGLYVTDSKITGIDYSVFKGPVLLNEQTGFCKEVLQKYFGNKMTDLGIESLIIEKPGSSEIELNSTELEFEKHLGFHTGFYKKPAPKRSDDFSDIIEDSEFDNLEVTNKKGIERKIKQANLELENILWRVGRLVHRDGVTTDEGHLYLFKNHEIVLNLYNPTIRQLVKLSAINPNLAGHWAMAMCILDQQNILPHITAETREDLLMFDALNRIASQPENRNTGKSTGKRIFQDMLYRFKNPGLN